MTNYHNHIIHTYPHYSQALNCQIQYKMSIRHDPFGTCAKFSKILTSLPPDTHTYVCVSEGQKCQFFGKFCVRTKLIIPINFALFSYFCAQQLCWTRSLKIHTNFVLSLVFTSCTKSEISFSRFWSHSSSCSMLKRLGSSLS